MFLRRSKPLSYAQRRALGGVLFTLPWVLGTVFFILRPLASSLIYSFNDLAILVGDLDMEFVGLKHYVRAFTTDARFLPLLTGSLTGTLFRVPVIVIFSLFIALILKDKFRGRTLVRALFFLPVIVSSGVVITIMTTGEIGMELEEEAGSVLLQADVFETMLFEAGLRGDLIEILTDFVNSVLELGWYTGVQILIFLAGLQSIPPHLYEVSAIEGATGWENFWKITIPVLSPIILLNIVYTLIDGFTDYSSEIMRMINELARSMAIEYSAALSWIYFVIVFAFVAVAYLIINKRVFYMAEG